MTVTIGRRELLLLVVRKVGRTFLAVFHEQKSHCGATGQTPKHIADLVLKYRLPAATSIRQFVEAGGLVSYGAGRLTFP
jgi:hypothetical protein